MPKAVLELSNCFAPNVGGVETHLTDLVAELAQRGWAVNVVAFYPFTTRVPWTRYEETHAGRVRIWRLWWFGHNWFHVLEKYPPLQFLYLVPRLFIGALSWLLRHRREVDVIHAHGLAAGFCARILGRWFGKRTVFSSHAVYNFKAGGLLPGVVKWILSGMDQVLTLSDQSRAELIGTGLEQHRVRTFHYWIDLNRFGVDDRSAARQALKVKGDCPVCLFVGRLIPQKGVRLFVELAQDARLQGVQFWMAGVGPMEDWVRDETTRTPNLKYWGNVANTDLAIYYRAADLLCVPSQYQEGFGRVIIEAMACGTPVLGADCPGIREALAGRGGWVVPPTVKDFGGRLTELMERPADLAGIRSACRAVAEAQYSTRNMDVIEAALQGEPVKEGS